MKYKRFEDLPVWRAAGDPEYRVGRVVEHASFRLHPGLADQLDRAAVSVANNIAERSERGTTAEPIAFLYYARGSGGEVRSMVRGLARRAAEDGSLISDLRSEISELRILSESVSRPLHGSITQLQNTDIRGPRHLTDDARARYERRHRPAALLRKVEALRPRFEDPQR